MNIPINKNRSWIAHLHKGIDQRDEHTKAAIMRPAGMACASDLLSLCEKYLEKKIESLEDLVTGWNMVRERRNLTGKWVLEGNSITGVFRECGCPLVRSGLIELHPVQCYCSQGLMETIFSQAADRPVQVEIKRSIGRGDDVCDFLIKL
jgi:predicted hydrocarbon binding protein